MKSAVNPSSPMINPFMTREPQEETEGNDAKQDTPTLKRESNEPENDKVKSAPIETIQN
jgi:hypothetical protein